MNGNIKRKKTGITVQIWHKWWWYGDWDNKGANCNQKDKWKHQWGSVVLGH